ncbi:MAG: endonuclease III [Sphingobacteriaceae bacterium]|nr:endonuclease III [Sphingobacteriaceae bacterium]
MLKQERFKAFVEYFSTHQPNAQTELHYNNPFQLLVAVILSAQCTDKRINQITPALFEKYPDAITLSQASAEEVFELIRSVSYPNNKAKHLVGMARLLAEKFDGEVPSSMEDLQTLPGVGRKTANVITSIVFEAPALAVDTHVFRVANRLGLTRNATTPLAVEKQLVNYLPEETIRHSHHWLILHGRYVCQARRPKCEVCPITWFCKYYAYQQTATALTKAAIADRKKEKALKERKKANKLSTVLKKFEVKE